jgi:hypothetical protein
MEILFNFLNWASSFSTVDEDTGSKMDIHNLATVVAPNILYSSNKNPDMDQSFLAIEAVHCLIECNESMCEVGYLISVYPCLFIFLASLDTFTFLTLFIHFPRIHPFTLSP